MVNPNEKLKFSHKLIMVLIALIPFQQFPVINIGIPIKLYDLISLLTLILISGSIKKYLKLSKHEFIFIIFLLIFSLTGVFLGFFDDSIDTYYLIFPDAINIL